MERLSFAAEAAFSLQEDLLDRVTIAPLTEPIAAGGPVQVAVFRVAAGGRIVRHAATVPQLLLVVEGTGRVSGGDRAEEPIAAGEAVFWERGEEHETRSDDGLTAVMVEGEGLRPRTPRG